MRTNNCVEAALCEAGAACIAPAKRVLSPANMRGGTSFGQSRLYTGAMSLALSLAAHAQETPPPAAAIEGVKGVKQDAVMKVQKVEPGIATGTRSTAQGVNKIDGIDTINGVKADGRTAVVPVKPVVEPVISGAGSIQAVNGVTGINAAKLQNLEAALQIKHGETGPPGKGRAAAAALGGAPGKPTKPKEDGRAGFQEFEKLQNSGS